VNKWLRSIRLLLGSSSCLLCQANCDGGLCVKCHADLPWHGQGCCHCAVALVAGDQVGRIQICGRCLRQAPAFDSSFAIFDYVDPVEWMVKRFKFHGDLVYGRLLGNLMVESLPQKEHYCRPDVIIPVPLHKKRMKDRGFNQALELAKVLGDGLGVLVANKAAVRKLATPQQSELTAKQRRLNIIDAFEVQVDYSGKHVVLVDDVMTTGATVNELAKQLKKKGVARVDVWVCARS